MAATRGDLLQLQSRMKRDPEGYKSELELQLRHFRACLDVLALEGPVAAQSGAGNLVLGTPPDAAASKELGDLAMFLAHVTPSYPDLLSGFPHELLQLLKNLSPGLPALLRRQMTQALILLRNRERIGLVDTLPVMMKLLSTGDKSLRKLVFSHLVQNICAMNRKHRNEAKNRSLQNIIFPLLQEEDEARAKNALKILCELYRRKIWTDERNANAICSACFHSSSRVMISTLKFLHGYDTQHVEEESDDSDEEEDPAATGMAALSKEAIYKARHKGTTSSRKRKQAKLERAARSIKRQQRLRAEDEGKASFAPLQHLQDPQSFAEKLYARLNKCNEKFQVKLMMIMAISRCIGMHQLLLLSFYPHLQRYVAPHQQDETHVLAAVVQACHDKVPVETVEPLLKQLVNTFVSDRARPEVIAVGLNVVREICARMPLIMTEELLEDLSMYKKSREKAVSNAANSIIGLYRQVHPGLLRKKDRGRGADISIQPKAFGENLVHTDVPGIELLAQPDSGSEDDGDEGGDDAEEENEEDDDDQEVETGDELEQEDDEISGDEQDYELENDEDENGGESSELEDDSEDEEVEEKEAEVEEEKAIKKRRKTEEVEMKPELDLEKPEVKPGLALEKMSLSQLKMVAAAKEQDVSIEIADGILSNEDFERIRKLQAKQLADSALAKHGVKSKQWQNSDALSQKPVNPAMLEAQIRKKQDKSERIAASKAGRDEGDTYKARAAVKKKKTGGLSNRQKEKKKSLPVAARRMKTSQNREQRRIKARRTNQFRGRKAWKS